MKRTNKRQSGLNQPHAYWVQTVSKTWAAFCHATRPRRQQRRASPRGLTPLPPGGLRYLSASTFSMLVESDVLAGSRGILP